MVLRLKAPLKEGVDALQVAVEVELCIGVLSRDHLGEVDDDYLLLLRYHQVELVEVRMDEAVLSEALDQVDALLEDSLHVAQLLDLAERVTGDQRHHDGVPVPVDRLGRRELVLVAGVHEGELLNTGKPAEVKPAVVGAVLQVVPVLLDSAEGSAPKSCQFEDDIVPIRVFALVDIGLLADAHFLEHLRNAASFVEDAQSEEVVAQVGHAIAVI